MTHKGADANLIPPCRLLKIKRAVFGVVSILMSLFGLELGHRVGTRVEEWSEEIGGGVLILVGVAIGAGVLG